MAILGAAAMNNATAGAVSVAKSAAQGTMDIISNYNPVTMTTGAFSKAKQQIDKITNVCNLVECILSCINSIMCICIGGAYYTE